MLQYEYGYRRLELAPMLLQLLGLLSLRLNIELDICLLSEKKAHEIDEVRSPYVFLIIKS
jgi:hypothetical protein